MWAAPAILTLDAAAAATCCTATGPVQIINDCSPNTNDNNPRCNQPVRSNTVTVCRLRNQSMRFSRNNLGNQEPYADELVVLTVTPPAGSGGAVQIQNFIHFEPDCRNTAATRPDFTLTSVNQCSTTATPAIDITPLFGTFCGVFTVRAQVFNVHNPFGWSTMWIYPV